MCHPRLAMVTPTRTNTSTSISHNQRHKKLAKSPQFHSSQPSQPSYPYHHYQQHSQSFNASPTAQGSGHWGKPSPLFGSSLRSSPPHEQKLRPVRHPSGPSEATSPKKIVAARTQSSSPLTSTPRGSTSPQGCRSLHGSPHLGNSFAASKCFEPPTPSALPKPPITWCASSAASPIPLGQLESDALSNHLKLLLKVQA